MTRNGSKAADGQAATIAALRRLSATASPTGAPETIETHAAIVFFVGDAAYKLKKAVDLGYLDFTTRDKRLSSCQAEVALNKPNAPQIYRDVVPVVADADGTIARGAQAGTGTVVDYVVHMVRFDQAALFSERIRHGGLSDELLVRTARMIARMHAGATPSGEAAAVTRLCGVVANIASAIARARSEERR